MPYGEERLVYENRFRAFEDVPVPQYIPYHSYEKQLKIENEAEQSFETLLAEGVASLKAGAARLGKLATTPEDLRSTEIYSTAKLQELQKIAVRNSLNIVKLKMQRQKAENGELMLVVDRENSVPECPVLDLQPKPVRR